MHRLEHDFRHFVSATSFPCVGAKAALARNRLDTMVCRSVTSNWDDLAVAQRLIEFAGRWRRQRPMFTSLAVIFEGPRSLSEEQFERCMWCRAQSISDKDRWLGQCRDKRMSPDPENPDFGLSFGGQGFFLVGLHPHASRRARRFSAPVIVFNLHAQFDQLRTDGKYEGMRAKILERDRLLSGSINPMLARHGESSEARQYSGRAVAEDWRCPFHTPGERHDHTDSTSLWHGLRTERRETADSH